MSTVLMAMMRRGRGEPGQPGARLFSKGARAPAGAASLGSQEEPRCAGSRKELGRPGGCVKAGEGRAPGELMTGSRGPQRRATAPAGWSES